jgi:hypothetical protein
MALALETRNVTAARRFETYVTLKDGTDKRMSSTG